MPIKVTTHAYFTKNVFRWQTQAMKSTKAQGGSLTDGVHVIGMGYAQIKVKENAWNCKIYKEAMHLDADIYHVHDPESFPYAVKLKKERELFLTAMRIMQSDLT